MANAPDSEIREDDMSTKEARGTKRTCQNPECGARFYDLNRDPIICPICEEVYKLLTPEVEDAPVEKVTPEPAEAPAASSETASDGEEVTDDDALVSLEDADEEISGGASDDEDDDTFLETDDEESDGVTGIIGDVPTEDEET